MLIAVYEVRLGVIRLRFVEGVSPRRLRQDDVRLSDLSSAVLQSVGIDGFLALDPLGATQRRSPVAGLVLCIGRPHTGRLRRLEEVTDLVDVLLVVGV